MIRVGSCVRVPMLTVYLAALELAPADVARRTNFRGRRGTSPDWWRRARRHAPRRLGLGQDAVNGIILGALLHGLWRRPGYRRVGLDRAHHPLHHGSPFIRNKLCQLQPGFYQRLDSGRLPAPLDQHTHEFFTWPSGPICWPVAFLSWGGQGLFAPLQILLLGLESAIEWGLFSRLLVR